MAPWLGVSLAIFLTVTSHLLENAPHAPDGGSVINLKKDLRPIVEGRVCFIKKLTLF